MQLLINNLLINTELILTLFFEMQNAICEHRKDRDQFSRRKQKNSHQNGDDKITVPTVLSPQKWSTVATSWTVKFPVLSGKISDIKVRESNETFSSHDPYLLQQHDQIDECGEIYFSGKTQKYERKISPAAAAFPAFSRSPLSFVLRDELNIWKKMRQMHHIAIQCCSQKTVQPDYA